MYSIHEVLASIDRSFWTAIATGSVVLAGAYGMYIEAIRLGFRDRTHSIPPFSNMYFFAHDVCFVSLYSRWFCEINHVLYKMFWWALVVFVAMESVVHYQTLKYSRRELFPSLTPKQYIVAYVLMQAGVAVIFWFIYEQLGDHLFLLNFTCTLVLSNVFTIPMLMKRNSPKGQSIILLGTTLVSTVGLFFLFLPLVSSHFTTAAFRTLGVGVTVLGFFNVWCLKQYPRAPCNGRILSRVESRDGAFSGWANHWPLGRWARVQETQQRI